MSQCHVEKKSHLGALLTQTGGLAWIRFKFLQGYKIIFKIFSDLNRT
jgi:hypothetical protein